MSGKKNVLLICVDEMRADHLACMGNPLVKTPNLDRLAAMGTLFRRGYCNNPICMPARASMFTGLLPRDHGLRVNGQTAHPGLPWLAQIMAEAGYRTHAAGKLHLTPWVGKSSREEAEKFPEDMDFWRDGTHTTFPAPYFGFQSVDFVGGHSSYIYGDYLEWLKERGGHREDLQPAKERISPGGQSYRMALPEELHYNRFIADSAIGVIEESASPDAPPFLVWCSFPDPHAPVAAPNPYYDLYPPEDMPLPARREGEVDDLPQVYRQVLAGDLRPNGCNSAGITDAQWQEILAGTYAMVTHLDNEVGRLLDCLERTGQLDDTLVVFLSDHGDMMGDHGLLWKAFYTFRGCIQIPYIVALPGGAAGAANDALVCQLDLLPSVLDWCQLPLPGADWTERETPFSRGEVQPLQLYPGRSWLPVARGQKDGIRDCVVVENDDPTMGFRVRCLVTDHYRLTVYPGMDEGELFDLRNDPNELRNLWSQPASQARRHELTAKLLDAYALETPLHPIPPWNA